MAYICGFEALLRREKFLTGKCPANNRRMIFTTERNYDIITYTIERADGKV